MELMEYPLADDEAAMLSDLEASNSKSNARGRPRIPESWTQVLNVDKVGLEHIKAKVIANDLLLASSVPNAPVNEPKVNWVPYFYPKEFVKENKAISTLAFALAPSELRRLGVQVTDLRRRLLQKA